MLENMSYNKEKFQKRFCELTRDKKLREICRECGLDVGLASSYKKGVRIPAFENIIRICSCYNVSADWIMGLSDKNRRGDEIEF